MLENLQKSVIEKPVDKIIRQMREFITSGQWRSGDRLPSERELALYFGVGRGIVRAAIQKLEFYGLLRTNPQSGTIVERMGLRTMEGMMSRGLNLENADFAFLIEARVFLEISAVQLAAQRRTTDDIIALTEALSFYKATIATGIREIEEDLHFHAAIAAASKNKVLSSFMSIITPDIMKNFVDMTVCDTDRFQRTVKEHQEILDYIIKQDPIAAGNAMQQHLHDLLEFSTTINQAKNKAMKLK